MKLPHISIEYHDEETFAPDTVSLSLVAGFGMHWAWMWLVIFNGPVLFYPGNPEMFRVVFVATICVFAATLLSYGAFLKAFRALFATPQQRMRNRTVGMLAVIAGTALLWLLNPPGSHVATVAASALLNGVGSAVLLMSYGVSTSVLDIAEAVACTAGSLLVGSLVFAALLLAQQFATPLGAVLCLAIPVIEYLCLWLCSKRLVDRMEFSTLTLSVHTGPFALHVCGPMLVLGVVLGYLRPLSLLESHVAGAFSEVAAAFVLGGFLVAVLAMIAMFMQRQRNNFMFRTLFPLCALLLVLDCLPQGTSAFLNAFCLFGTYLMIEACSWVMLSDISQRFRLSAFTVFGFGRGALAVGALVGFLVPPHNSLGLGHLGQIDALAILTLALLLFGMALLPKNAELRKTLKLGANCPALRGDEQYAVVSEQEFDQAILAEAQGAQAARPTTAAPAEGTGSEAADADGADTSEENGLHEETGESLTTINEIQERIEAEEREGRQLGRFKRKCAAVADTYLLSRKETEVLFLLAKGRNAAAIQEQLYISAGTANTHMRHIYRKLNVHSQQELIRLVESTEVDELEL